MRDRIDYWGRVFLKVFCFGVFGIGAAVLGSVGFPTLALVSARDPAQLRKRIRGLVSRSFSRFVKLMIGLGLIRVEFAPGDEEKLRSAKGVIVVANHPSLIDVVLLIACMPQADCIVKDKLFETPFIRSVVGKVYIPNSLGFEATADRCLDSLEEGNSIIIFPEGTRTSRAYAPRLKRGAAHIALRTSRDLLPVVIKVDDPVGLRKGDPFLSISREAPIRYFISVQEPIQVSDFKGAARVGAARSLTCSLANVITRQSE